MTIENTSHDADDRACTVVLINSDHNPSASIDEHSFKANWRWLKAPPSWTPGQSLPVEPSKIDALIVFASKDGEDEVGQLCGNLRQEPSLDAVPLLVAVDQYQMPFANRMREMPKTDYILTPIEEGSLARHLARAKESREVPLDQIDPAIKEEKE